jgi:hypothetical protein
VHGNLAPGAAKDSVAITNDEDMVCRALALWLGLGN